MRDLKFRAWYGDIMVRDLYAVGVDELGPYFCEDQTGDFLYCNSLMQYTGLKDKNGVEIYEGDVIRLHENDNGYFEVVFLNAYVGGWVLKNKHHSEVVSLGARDASDLEIIGNRHENPELLQE